MQERYSNWQRSDNSWGRFLTVMGFIFVPLLGIFGLRYFIAPEVKRPIYNSREECLADWAVTPKDCQEATSHGGGRLWYGPWMDSRGKAYHSNGMEDVYDTSKLHNSGFSGSERMGFGASGGSSRYSSGG
ncbi:MAG: hypothetical protein ACRCV6_00070 [Formosimonas sp.]